MAQTLNSTPLNSSELDELKKELDVIQLEDRLEMVQLTAASDKEGSQCANGQCERSA